MIRTNTLKRTAGCLVAVLALSAGPAWAAPIVFNGSLGNLAASTTFATSGSNLIITLTNTSTFDVLQPADVLTAVFFDIEGPVLSLNRVSAIVPGGSTVLFGGTDPGGVVGGEWSYRNDVLASPPGTQYGISSAGFGPFGETDRFPGNNLQGPNGVDGLQYGITSAGDNPATGNTPVTGTNALIRNTVVFTLSGLPAGFDPSTKICNVYWQYGTSFDEPRIPEPTTAAMLVLGAVAGLRRRFAI